MSPVVASRDLLTAIQEAQNEQCVGENFPEATAYDARLEAIKRKLEDLRSRI
jgi:hypothetical protein